MANTFTALSVDRMHRSFMKTLRAYLAKPEVLTVAHDDQMYWLGRQLAHEARRLMGESR